MTVSWEAVVETVQGRRGTEGSKKVDIRRRHRVTPQMMTKVEVSGDEAAAEPWKPKFRGRSGYPRRRNPKHTVRTAQGKTNTDCN